MDGKIEKAQKITKKLENHPLACFFEVECAEDEETVVNFAKIREKIENKSFKNVNEWNDAMTKMFDEGFKEYKDDALITGALNELFSIFQNETNCLKYTDEELWLLNMKTELKKLNECLSKVVTR